MNLQNETLIDSAAYAKFQLFRKRFCKSSAFLNGLIYTLALLIAAACICFGIIFDMVLLILFGILILLFLLRIFSDRCIKPHKSFSKNKLRETTVEYRFTNNAFSTLEEENSGSSVKYAQLQAVYDTRDFFYLYLQKNVYFLVKKSGFASAEDLAKFSARMREVMGKKYISCS